MAGNGLSSVASRQEVMMEFSALTNPGHCPLGMYVTPTEDLFTWSGVLFVHQGYYRSAVFHFVVKIPSTYPNTAPSIYFLTDVFHPLVDPGTGKLSLTCRFPTWRPHLDFILHALHYLKSAFKRTSLDSLREAQCLNKEAYRLSVPFSFRPRSSQLNQSLRIITSQASYREQTHLFTKLATQCAQLSITDSALYNNQALQTLNGSPSVIKFRKLKPGEEQTLKQELEQQVRARLVPRTYNRV